jgi:purine-nucleoside phosphorylase
MSTPHNSAQKGQIAKTVLMPGDPLRAQFIAEHYLDDAREFSHVRGMLGFTGLYKGTRLSVMGSGMGMPSMGIYSYELFTHYDVDAVVRIGSAGGYSESLKVFDVLLVTEAWSESTYAMSMSGSRDSRVRADAALSAKLRGAAAKLGTPLVEGAVHCSDVFYRAGEGDEPYWRKVLREQGCAAVEMESFALFHNARVTGKQAACLLTVSDTLWGGAVTTAEERERSFTQMIEIALLSAALGRGGSVIKIVSRCADKFSNTIA